MNKNFLRTLRMACRYRFTLVGATVAALGVAVLWGCSNSARVGGHGGHSCGLRVREFAGMGTAIDARVPPTRR